MSFPRYPKYKESGVEWLGEVPEHWGIGSVRWLTRRYSGGTPDKTNLGYWEDGTIPWLNSGAVNDRVITEPSTYITAEAFENSSAKWIPEGALVMALAGQGKTKGMVAQLAIRSTCNQSMAAIIPGSEIYAPYLFWWLDSNYQNIRNMAGGDLRDGLNLELLGNIQCPLPTTCEQTAIAAFLDRETAKIDALVAEQQRLIELLKEKHQAVISHAVTKGLNPNAPMKPSGIGWLGDVPEHWEAKPLKYYITKIEQGWSPQCEGEPAAENEWGVLKVGCGNHDKFDPAEQKALPLDIAPQPNYEIKAGDILMSRGNTLELVGMATFVERVRPRLLLCDLLYRFRAKPGQADSEFLVYSLRSPNVRYQIEREATGASSSMKKIGQGTIREFLIALPPLEEQKAIVALIKTVTVKLDALSAEAQRAIDLLQERRIALISAAVTGQIDVQKEFVK